MERDQSIDIIRSVGLFCIILAHVSPPFIIFQIRNFDVPLMVFISGYLFGNKEQKFQSIVDFLLYLWKRFVRLVVPVWIFLTLFYIIQYTIPSIFEVNYTLFPDKMLSSYLMMEGFGYVWIIRIFLMIAILGPLFNKFIKKPWHLLLFYIIYEILIFNTKAIFDPHIQRIFDQFGTYSLGFLLFFLLGSQYRNFDKTSKNLLLFCSAIICFSGLIYYSIYLKGTFDIGALKYPPHSYYVYYAVLISSILFMLKPKIEKIKSPFLSFVGSSTIWIYLWHILFIFLINFDVWYINWIVILTISIAITFLQQKFVEWLIVQFNISSSTSKQLRIIFCS